jgi:hypothetical protein
MGKSSGDGYIVKSAWDDVVVEMSSSYPKPSGNSGSGNPHFRIEVQANVQKILPNHTYSEHSH